jgi:hypothetical protein
LRRLGGRVRRRRRGAQFGEARLHAIEALLQRSHDVDEIVARRLELVAQGQQAVETLGLRVLLALDARHDDAGRFEFL